MVRLATAGEVRGYFEVEEIGSWRLVRKHGELDAEISLAGERSPMVELAVVIRLHGARFDAMSRPPSVRRVRYASWNVRGIHLHGEELRARIEFPLGARAHLLSDEYLNEAQGVTYALVGALVALIALFLVRRAETRDGLLDTRTSRRLSRAALAAVLIGAGQGILSIVNGLDARGVLDLQPVLPLAVPALVAVVVLGFVVAIGAGRRRGGLFVAGSILAVGVPAALVASSYQSFLSPNAAVDIAAFTLVAALAFAAGAALFTLLAASWPITASKKAGLSVAAALVAACIANYTWWAWALADRFRDYERLGYPAGSDDFVRVASLEAPYYPYALLGELTAFASFVGLGVLVSVAWHAAKRKRDSVVIGRGSAAAWCVIVAFAAFVATTSGALFGLAFPLPFVVALILIRLLIRFREPVAESLQRGALELEAATQPTRDVTATPGGPESDAEAAAAAAGQAGPGPLGRFGRLGAAIGRSAIAAGGGFLPDSDSKAARGEEPPPDPVHIALARGPKCWWWGNGVLALKRGAPLAVIPAIHYVVVLVDAQHEAVGRASSIGWVMVIRWALQEYAFWLVAAFVLGALYAYLPGRSGLSKAVWIAGIFTAAQISGEVLPGDYDVLKWAFLASEVLIVLSLVGALMDLETFKREGLDRSDLYRAYGLNHPQRVATLLAVAVPLVVFLLQQLFTGEALQAIGELSEPVSPRSPEQIGARSP